MAIARDDALGLDEVAEALDSGWTLPARWYSDPDVAQLEHERIFARDGVLDRIDGAVYSSEIPWTKPHHEAFRAALDAVSVSDPADAVFVGDRPFDDIHGASSIGMRTILIPHLDIPTKQQGPVIGTPDAVVHRLGEVLGVVDGVDDPEGASAGGVASA